MSKEQRRKKLEVCYDHMSPKKVYTILSQHCKVVAFMSLYHDINPKRSNFSYQAHPLKGNHDHYHYHYYHPNYVEVYSFKGW